jgi:hypothetical protein
VPDYLLFVQGQKLFAQRMDWEALRQIDKPLLVTRNVAASPAYLGTSEFTASQNGALIYGRAEGSSFDQFNWYSRDGTVTDSIDPIIDFQQFTLSPDGKYLALNSFHQHATGSMWLIDLESNTTTPLTTDPHAQSDPVWSPDSRYVAFDLLPNGGSDPPYLVQKIAIGTQQSQPVYGDNGMHWTEDWSADGRFLLTHNNHTCSIIPLTGDRKPKPLYSSTFVVDEFHLSPDGQLIAYGEDRTGRWEVYVALFPSFHNIQQVSMGGGAQPRWREDGRELFFIDLEGKMMSVAVERGSPPKIGVHTLAGDLDELRERMIGVEMFHRRADYDTSEKALRHRTCPRSQDQSVCSHRKRTQVSGPRTTEGFRRELLSRSQLARDRKIACRRPNKNADEPSNDISRHPGRYRSRTSAPETGRTE